MTLKSRLKTCSFAFLLIFLPLAGTLSQTNIQDYDDSRCVTQGGRIIVFGNGTVREFRPGDGVTHASCRGGYIYYLRCGAEGSIFAGRLSLDEGVPLEAKAGLSFANGRMRKISGGGGTVHLLIDGEGGDELSVLYSIDLQSGALASRKGVMDFLCADGKMYLLENRQRAIVLAAGVEAADVSLTGNVSFAGSSGGRIAVVANPAGDCEIFDIALMKSVYLFSRDKKYPVPETHNLVVEAVDEYVLGKGAESFVFYKVFIDGAEAGRTNTGLASLPVVFRAMVEPGESHMLRLERWQLDRGREKYVRVNNIRQPEPMRFSLYANRIMKIKFLFDGRNYSTEKGAVFK